MNHLRSVANRFDGVIAIDDISVTSNQTCLITSSILPMTTKSEMTSATNVVRNVSQETKRTSSTSLSIQTSMMTDRITTIRNTLSSTISTVNSTFNICSTIICHNGGTCNENSDGKQDSLCTYVRENA